MKALDIKSVKEVQILKVSGADVLLVLLGIFKFLQSYF